MATVTEHSSPPKPRHHKKKNSDPFSLHSPPSLTSAPQDAPQEAQDPLLTRIFMTPLLFTSFLLSLFLINRSDRARRTTRPHSLWSYLTPSIWLDPEPYQDPQNSTWNTNTGTTASSSTHYEPHSALNPGGLSTGADAGQMVTRRKGQGKEQQQEKWHLNNSVRKISKLEITNAFEWQGFAAVALIIFILVVGIGFILLLGYATMIYSERRYGMVNHERGGRFF